VLSFALVALTLLAAAVPGLFTGTDPLQTSAAARLQAPSGTHPFGTDHLGRDLWSRVVHGSSLSVEGAAIAVAVGLVIGTTLGLLAGTGRGVIDGVLMRGVDTLLAVPPLLMAMALVTALGFGTRNVAVAIGLTTMPGFARVMRSEVLRVRGMPYVEAARMLGGSRLSVLARHVLPNAVRPVLALATLDFGQAILAVAALSYLGFGAPPPAPEWGSLIAAGQPYVAQAWWLTVLPGLVIVVIALALNRISHGVRPR
jgi:peptide/nickel transport system permease protein